MVRSWYKRYWLISASLVLIGITIVLSTVTRSISRETCLYIQCDWIIKRIFFSYQNAVRGYFLGCTCGLGIIISFCQPDFSTFGWYLTALSIFHWSEYYTTAVTNPKSLTLESYLLDHSREYKIAAAASWIEFWVEWCIFPGKYSNNIEYCYICKQRLNIIRLTIDITILLLLNLTCILTYF